MNKLGRNKTLWLKKQGCIFKEVPDTFERDGGNLTDILTEKGEYVSLADLGERSDVVNFIYKHRLTNLMSLRRAKGLPVSEKIGGTVSVGFNEKEQAWYGWTHRGYGKFYIGFEIKKGSIMDNPESKYHYPFKVETLDQAKELAVLMSEYLD